VDRLQWGPVVVTGISTARGVARCAWTGLQWGPVVVTGISPERGAGASPALPASMGSGRGDRNQLWNLWGTLNWLRPASMGSGRGDRNQQTLVTGWNLLRWASMGSGRGDRNQRVTPAETTPEAAELQWGPVVVTGISWNAPPYSQHCLRRFNGVRSW